MAEYRRTIAVKEQQPASDGDYTHLLPTDPLSFLVLHIRCLNAGTNTKATLAQILSAIEKVLVAYKGDTVIDINGADLYVLNCVLFGKEPLQENVVNTDNAYRSLSLIIPFGKKLYDPAECFPATAKGDLTVTLTVDIADTGYDTLKYQIDAVTLPAASPTSRLKIYTVKHTPSSTGETDIDLPRGNKVLGYILRSYTVPAGTSTTCTIGKSKLLADNKEVYIVSEDFEGFHQELARLTGAANAWAEKFHMENTAASYTQNADTATEEQDMSDVSNYGLIDFGIGVPEDFILDTAPLRDLKLRVTAGDTNEIRVIAIERLPV